MNKIKTIFVSVLLLTVLSFVTSAQDKTINSGYVFIDGKYIEPPYKIKAKKDFITINGTIAFKLNKSKPYKKLKITEKFPGYPPDTIKGNAILKYVNPKTNNLLLADVVTYYLDKYDENIARDSIKNYICNIPEINCLKEEKGIVLYYPEYNKTATLAWKSLYLKNKTSSTIPNKNILKSYVEDYSDLLKNNSILFFQNGNEIFIVYKNKSKIFLNKAIPIINSDLPISKKITKLDSLGFKKIPAEILNKKIKHRNCKPIAH